MGGKKRMALFSAKMTRPEKNPYVSFLDKGSFAPFKTAVVILNPRYSKNRNQNENSLPKRPPNKTGLGNGSLGRSRTNDCFRLATGCKNVQRNLV